MTTLTQIYIMEINSPPFFYNMHGAMITVGNGIGDPSSIPG